MTIISGPQDGVKYTLTNADGTVVTFNDKTDVNYVGMVRWTGLDSADVRENATELVEADGGIHGNFWYGRRPVVGTIEIVPSSTVDRNTKTTALAQAANCLRQDAILSWTPDGGVAQFIRVRRNQPLRRADEPGWKTTYSLPLVSADPRIYSNTLTSASVTATAAGAGGFVFPLTFPLTFGGAPALGDILATNNGNAETPPIIRVDGPISTPSIKNVTKNQTIQLNYTLGTGEWFIIDVFARTISLNGITNRYSALDFANTTGWWNLAPGLNDIRLGGFGFAAGVTALSIQYRDAWI
jgi:hypothetical protein